MKIARGLFLAVAASWFLTLPLLADDKADPHGTGMGGGMGAGMRGGSHGTSGGLVQSRGRSYFVGGPRGPVGWSDFHHDTAPAKVSPHRYASTNLPKPSAWHGDMHDFDLDRWQGGGWQHGSHNGRSGWWWVVGPDWFFFDEPVYPYPDLYTPLGYPFGWWYWCDPYNEYYPFVTYCPVEWESVMPSD